jgi:MYXO-CTERM domain-containing protein
MRLSPRSPRFHGFSALSLGLLSLTLGGEALAAKGLVIRTGPFPAASIAATQRASASALERSAKALLVEQIPEGNRADLGRASTIELSSGERVVKIPQIHQGLPVALRGVAVAFGANDAAQVISAALEADLPLTVTPQISAAEAARSASAKVGVDLDPARAELAVWPTPNGATLVWALDAPGFTTLPYLPVVLVDATTGEVVLRYNAVTSANQANVYPTNPSKSPSLAKVLLDVGSGQTRLQNDLVQSLNCIDTHKLKNNVHLCELLQIAIPDSKGEYLSVAPAADAAPEDAFAELSMFYHVNQAYKLFRSYQPGLVVEQGAIPTVSNLRFPDPDKLGDPKAPLLPFQNAFFTPQNPVFGVLFGINGGAMFFGQGPSRDYSYDGDVIYHEFTHAVVNATLKLVSTPHLDEYGVSYSPGGMNEALADFFSAALSGDPDVGEYAVKDLDPTLEAVRSLANPDACPTAIGGEVHQDATLFSGSLWDVRKTLSQAQQTDYDRAVFKAMNSSMSGDLAYEEFAKLILIAVEGSPLGKPVADALATAFTKRGLLPRCTRVLESTGEELSGPKDLKGIWFAPGTLTTGVKTMTGGYSPGVVQVHQKLPENPVKLTAKWRSVELNGGGGGLPGMDGTPFAPKLLVRFGAEPIKFTYQPPAATADVVLADAVKSATDYTVTVEIPKGAKDAYVMIGNTGESDGAYTALKLTVEAIAVETPPSSSSGGGSGSMPNDTPQPEESGGCGCTLPGQESGRAGAGIAALAAVGLFAARRRRRG